MTIKIIKTLTSVAVLAIASNSVWAAGTTAGTGVDNTATISYSVSGTGQEVIESSENGNTVAGLGNGESTSFIVDKKVDVDVTAGAASQNIVAGGTATHSFTVTNEGNDIEYFNLTDLDTATGDVFDVSGCVITVNSVTGGLPAIPVSDTVVASAAIPSVDSPLRLGPDGTAAVTMVCTAPANAALVTGDDADVSLIATAVTTSGGTTALTNTAGADTAGKDTVLADAAGSAVGDVLSNAAHSAVVKNLINTAALTVKKESAVLCDPITVVGCDDTYAGLPGDSKRIPDAVIQYDITVSNSSAEATHLTIADTLPGDLTWESCALTGDAVVNATAPDSGLALGCDITGSTSFTLPAGTALAPSEAVLTIFATVN